MDKTIRRKIVRKFSMHKRRTRNVITLWCGMLLCILPCFGNSQDAMITIREDANISLKEVFDIIKDQTDYAFVYKSDLINNAPKVAVKKGKISVGKLLQLGLNAINSTFEITNNNTIVVKKLPPAVTNHHKEEMKPNETFELSGTVIDENSEPVIGVSVFVSSDNPETEHDKLSTDFILRGTVTDIEGRFVIEAEAGHYLGVSGIGYEPYSMPIADEVSDLKIVLKPSTDRLDEVLVVGYGTTTKRDLTGSVSSASAEDISFTQNQSVDQKLSGLFSGVQVTSSGGKPGAGAEIHIRGLSAIRGSNQPLYVIDGTPVVVSPNFGGDNESIAGLGGSRENPLLGINPEDIERIDVLKDASAAAIYGSRAAHGVILITTKQGKRNSPPRVNFSVTTAIQNPLNKYDALSPQQYKKFIQGIYPKKTDKDFFNGNTNWQDEITNNNALMTRYNASISGGTDTEKYYLSGSATKHEGVLKDNVLKRYTLSAKIDTKVAHKLNIGTSLNYNYSINKSSNITSLMDGLDFRPDVGIFDKNGKYTTKTLTKEDFDTGVQKIIAIVRNPVGRAENSPNITRLHNFLGNVYGEYEIIENLKIKSQVNVRVYNSLASAYHPQHTEVAQGRWGNIGTVKKPLSRLVINDSRSYNTVWTNTLTYNKTIANIHTINAVTGLSWDYYRMDLRKDRYYGFPDDEYLVNPASSQRADNVTDLTTVNALNSIFGRVNYTYDGKYLVTFTARRDGSTKFGPNNRYGFFPSGAIAWNIDKEDFMSGISQISYLKLRASMGITGSDNLPSFTYKNFASTLTGDYDSRYNKVNGIVPLGKPNPNIRWEETKQIDVGLEFGLFDDRLNAEIVYFQKLTSGLIMGTSIAYQFGSKTFNANVGDISNKGWEIDIGGDIIKTENFRWNSSFNISFIRNKVESFNGGQTGSWATGIQEGKPMGVLQGYRVLRIAQTQAEIDELNRIAEEKHGPGTVYQSNLKKPGDYIYKDHDGNGKIDNNPNGNNSDWVDLGDVNPDYFGGWTNKIYYKNFDFSINLQYVQGVDKSFSNFFNINLYKVEQKNAGTIVLDTWTAKNTNARLARLGSETLDNSNSRNVYDASFIRLRSVFLGYSLPDNWFDKTPFSSVRVGIGGNNLFTITDYPGLDPEAGSKGNSSKGTPADLSTDNGQNYPTVRSFSATINVTF